jgi:hypothetical protein
LAFDVFFKVEMMSKSCDACGYLNDDDAAFCARCGGSLKASKDTPPPEDDCFGEEDDCFDSSYGGAICGLLIGLLIIVWAVSQFIPGLSALLWTYWWPIGLLIVGLLIIASALFAITRQRR